MGLVVGRGTTVLGIVPASVDVVGRVGSVLEMRSNDGAEGLLLALVEETVGRLAWWDVRRETASRMRMLIVVAQLLGWKGNTSCFINVEQMAFKFSKGGKIITR